MTELKEARKALADCREFLIGLTRPAAAGIYTISSYHPVQALIDKIDSALRPPLHGTREEVALQNTTLALDEIIQRTANPAPTNMSDRRVLDWVNGKARALCGTLSTALPPAPPSAGTQDREAMAAVIYEGAHKGLRNCWKWTDDGLDAEHPGRRGYYYKIADAVLAALTQPDTGEPEGCGKDSVCAFEQERMRAALEDIRRKAQNFVEHWQRCLDSGTGWKPRRSHIESARSNLQHIANDISSLILAPHDKTEG